MNITYQLLTQNGPALGSDGSSVTLDNPAYQAWIAAGNVPTILPPAAPTLTPMQIAQAGIQIVSASTPALNGTYPVDDVAQNRVSAQIDSILEQSTFTNGTTVHAWMDTSGNPHAFSSTAEFIAFAKAFGVYCDQIAMGIVPTNPVTIA